jgi:hypothetical protein
MAEWQPMLMGAAVALSSLVGAALLSPAPLPKAELSYSLLSYGGWHWNTVVTVKWLWKTWVIRQDCPRDFAPWAALDFKKDATDG